jgi:hypothetical protein
MGHRSLRVTTKTTPLAARHDRSHPFAVRIHSPNFMIVKTVTNDSNKNNGTTLMNFLYEDLAMPKNEKIRPKGRIFIVIYRSRLCHVIRREEPHFLHDWRGNRSGSRFVTTITVQSCCLRRAYFPGAGVFQRHAAEDCVFAQRNAAALSLTLRCDTTQSLRTPYRTSAADGLAGRGAVNQVHSAGKSELSSYSYFTSLFLIRKNSNGRLFRKHLPKS